MLNLHILNLLTFLNLVVVFIDSFRFFIKSVTSSVNLKTAGGGGFTSFPNFMSAFTAVARTSSKMLNTSYGRGYSCPVPYFRGMHSIY